VVEELRRACMDEGDGKKDRGHELDGTRRHDHPRESDWSERHKTSGTLP
jgi:hypothetical protein